MVWLKSLKGETGHGGMGQNGVILQIFENIRPAGQVIILSSIAYPFLHFPFCEQSLLLIASIILMPICSTSVAAL